MMTTRTVPRKRSKVHVNPGTLTAAAAAIAVAMFLLLYFVNSLTRAGSYPVAASTTKDPHANAAACRAFDSATSLLHRFLVTHITHDQAVGAESMVLATQQVITNVNSYGVSSTGDTQMAIANVISQSAVVNQDETSNISAGVLSNNYLHDAPIVDLIQAYRAVPTLCAAAGVRLINTLG